MFKLEEEVSKIDNTDISFFPLFVKKQIIKMFEEGYTEQQIADAYEITIPQVIALLQPKIDKEKVQEMLQKGCTIKEIAQYFNVSRQTLYEFMSEHGIKKKREIDWDQLKELLEKGKTLEELALLYNTSKQRIREKLGLVKPRQPYKFKTSKNKRVPVKKQLSPEERETIKRLKQEKVELLKQRQEIRKELSKASFWTVKRKDTYYVYIKDGKSLVYFGKFQDLSSLRSRIDRVEQLKQELQTINSRIRDIDDEIRKIQLEF